MVSNSNVSWMCSCSRNSGVKSASFVGEAGIKNSQFQLEKTTENFLSCDHSISPAASRAPRTRCSSYALCSRKTSDFNMINQNTSAGILESHPR